IGYKWGATLQQRKFRWVAVFFLCILLIMAGQMPAFFQYLQQRPGLVLNDFLLTVLPARDLSKFIFGLIYFSLAYIILRGVYSPVILLHFLIGYVVVLAVRVITLSLSPLEPPLGLVPLTDPGALFFYGGIEVTKDLFFSGHTATAFLIYLCLQERIEKAVALAAVIVLAVMLLIQHIHYTIDVLAAVPITYYCYQLSKRIAAYALG
ncbi:MAG TPA: phosphatase PAP2-related protein, partial [Saprospiraceae bacterium]|nr:phosphatase PAP2-related protein [Saprospiraceae bacterium]